MAALGFEPVVNTPTEFAARIKADIAKWAGVIEAAQWAERLRVPASAGAGVDDWISCLHSM